VGSGSAGQGITLYSSTSTAGSIHFADGTSGSEAYRGQLVYSHNGDYMAMYTAASEAMRIDSSGNVGIGTTSPSYPFHLSSSGDTVAAVTAGAASVAALNLGNSTNLADGGIRYDNSANALILRASNTERMRIDASGNVGIGKTPNTNFGGYVLQLNGGSQTFMSFGNSTTGTTLSDGLVIGNDNSGADIYQREAQPLRFHTSNTERIRIDASGNVGIGTSSPNGNGILTLNTPADNSAQIVFAENDTAKWLIGHRHDGDYFRFYDLANSAERMRIDSSGNLVKVGGVIKGERGTASAPAYSFSDDTDTGMFNIANADLGFAVGGSERMRIDSSGNVTVKASGADQARTLSLQGTNGASETYQFNLIADGENAAAKFMVGVGGGAATERMRIESSGTVKISHADTASEGFRVIQTTAARTSGGALGLFYDDQAGTTQPTLAVQQNGTGDILQLFDGGSQVVTVKDGGNVGIGTSSPAYKTQISDSGDTVLSVTSGDSNSASLYLGDAVATRGRLTYNNANDSLAVYTDNNERMRIDSSGNLLVGQSSHISPGNGSTTTGGGWTSSGRFWASTSSSDHGFNRNSVGVNVSIRNSGTQIGYIYNNASSVTYNTTSDQRLKENIANANDAGSKIDAIQVRQFDWKADGSHQDYGMVAQELLQVEPRAVAQPEDSESMMGVDYSVLVPMLIKEIQSLRNRVAQLEE